MVTKSTWDAISGIEPVTMGRQTSSGFISDPKRLTFVLSRYKFVAKMLSGSNAVLEVGCGDAFGMTVVAQVVNKIVGIDLSEMTLENATKHPLLEEKATLIKHDILEKPIQAGPFDSAYSLDVIEHIPEQEEPHFFANIVASLKTESMLIVGTPNRSAASYQSEFSMRDHINLKSQDELRETMSKYFRYVLMFGMNDEVLHTGFSEMAHYIFAVGLHPISSTPE